MTFAFVLDSTGNGRMIEYDDTTGQGSRGSGVLRKADPTAFSLSKLSGGYVFGMTGADNTEARMVNVGLHAGLRDHHQRSMRHQRGRQLMPPVPSTGSLSAINAQTGRGVSTVQSTNGTSHQAIYVVSASELVMEQIDSVPTPGSAAGGLGAEAKRPVQQRLAER